MTVRARTADPRWLVRFGYDGHAFVGWARQPTLRTVEGEIRRGLVRCGIVSDLHQADLQVASRTDRGVSARANALTVASPLPGSALLRALNGIAPDIFFTAAVEVEEAFRVRAAIRRRYRYFEPASDRRAGVWAETAKRFHGSIDVRSFGRGISSVRPLLRRVESIDVRRRGKWLTVDVVAPAFVWGMVRKIISAFREVDSGRLDLSDLESALQGIRRLTLPLAEPEFLVLWEVEYPVEWKHKATRPSRNQQRYAKQAKDQAEVRSQILQRLWPGLLQE